MISYFFVLYMRWAGSRLFYYFQRSSFELANRLSGIASMCVAIRFLRYCPFFSMCVDVRRDNVSDLPSFSLPHVLTSFQMHAHRPCFATHACLAEIAISKSANGRNVLRFTNIRFYDLRCRGCCFVNLIALCIISHCVAPYISWAGGRFFYYLPRGHFELAKRFYGIARMCVAMRFALSSSYEEPVFLRALMCAAIPFLNFLLFRCHLF